MKHCSRTLYHNYEIKYGTCQLYLVNPRIRIINEKTDNKRYNTHYEEYLKNKNKRVMV